jgi:hypothetical protein
MKIKIDHDQAQRTATALDEHAIGLRKSIDRMKECLEPLYKNWYQSGSPTGMKVHTHEGQIDTAMGVITTQMSGSGQVIAANSADLRKTDSLLAGN